MTLLYSPVFYSQFQKSLQFLFMWLQVMIISYSLKIMAIKEDTQLMINTPDGFDPRTYRVMVAGTLLKPVPNSPSTSNVWSALPKKEADLKAPQAIKYLYLEANTISSCSSIKELQSKLVFVGPLLQIFKELFLILSRMGIYNGETRHNSNSTGPKYEVQLQPGDIIGVGVDMIEGTLQYFRNGQSWGIAFKDPQLAKGELVAAISLIYTNDVVTLRTIVKQD